MTLKQAVREEIEVEPISPPPPAAFVADLDHAEKGHGELVGKISTRTRTTATDKTAFSRVATLVEGGSTADVKVRFNSPGLRREDRFITVSFGEEICRDRYVEALILESLFLGNED